MRFTDQLLVVLFCISAQIAQAAGSNWCKKHNQAKEFHEGKFWCLSCLDDPPDNNEPNPPEKVERCEKHNCNIQSIGDYPLCLDCLDEPDASDKTASVYSQSIEESGSADSKSIIFSTSSGLLEATAMRQLAGAKQSLTATTSRPYVTSHASASHASVSGAGISLLTEASTQSSAPEFYETIQWLINNGNVCELEEECPEVFPGDIIFLIRQQLDSPDLDSQLAGVDVYPTDKNSVNLIAYASTGLTLVIAVRVAGTLAFFVSAVPLRNDKFMLTAGHHHYQIQLPQLRCFFEWLYRNKAIRIQAFVRSCLKNSK